MGSVEQERRPVRTARAGVRLHCHVITDTRALLDDRLAQTRQHHHSLCQAA